MQLNKGKNDEISRYAASNPNCPPEALVGVLRRGKDNWVSCDAVNNPNFPLKILLEILNKGKDNYVSRNNYKNILSKFIIIKQ